MYTHMIKKSNQRCFVACWWPHEDASIATRERNYPLMHIEGGQVSRVKAENMRKISANG